MMDARLACGIVSILASAAVIAKSSTFTPGAVRTPFTTLMGLPIGALKARTPLLVKVHS